MDFFSCQVLECISDICIRFKRTWAIKGEDNCSKIENFLSINMTGSGEGGSYISVTGGKCPFIYLGEGVYDDAFCSPLRVGDEQPRHQRQLSPMIKVVMMPMRFSHLETGRLLLLLVADEYLHELLLPPTFTLTLSLQKNQNHPWMLCPSGY